MLAFVRLLPLHVHVEHVQEEVIAERKKQQEEKKEITVQVTMHKTKASLPDGCARALPLLGELPAETLPTVVGFSDATCLLAWLANHLIGRGLFLRAGDWVSTGLCTPVFSASLGDRIEADYAALGTVRVQF